MPLGFSLLQEALELELVWSLSVKLRVYNMGSGQLSCNEWTQTSVACSGDMLLPQRHVPKYNLQTSS